MSGSPQPSYAVLGVGALGSAIVTGLSAGPGPSPRIVLSPRGAATAAALAAQHPNVSVAAGNQAAVDGADVVLVCVRPADGEAVLRALELTARQVVVSAMAGVTVERLLDWVGPATRVARAIPMPAVAVRAGVTPVHPPLQEALALFDGLGGTVPIGEERTFEALSAATATVAAWYAYLGAIAAWLVREGLAPEAARTYVATTFAGAGGPLQTDFAGFDELVREVATPGGLNEQFARDLTRAGALAAVEPSLDAVLERLLGGR